RQSRTTRRHRRDRSVGRRFCRPTWPTAPPWRGCGSRQQRHGHSSTAARPSESPCGPCRSSRFSVPYPACRFLLETTLHTPPHQPMMRRTPISSETCRPESLFVRHGWTRPSHPRFFLRPPRRPPPGKAVRCFDHTERTPSALRYHSARTPATASPACPTASIGRKSCFFERADIHPFQKCRDCEGNV